MNEVYRNEDSESPKNRIVKIGIIFEGSDEEIMVATSLGTILNQARSVLNWGEKEGRLGVMPQEVQKIMATRKNQRPKIVNIYVNGKKLNSISRNPEIKN